MTPNELGYLISSIKDKDAEFFETDKVSLKGYLNFQDWRDNFIAKCNQVGLHIDESLLFDDDVDQGLRDEATSVVDEFVQTGIEKTVPVKWRAVLDQDKKGIDNYHQIVDKYGIEINLESAVDILGEFLTRPIPGDEASAFWNNIVSKFDIKELGGLLYLANIDKDKRQQILNKHREHNQQFSIEAVEEYCKELNIELPKSVKFTMTNLLTIDTKLSKNSSSQLTPPDSPTKRTRSHQLTPRRNNGRRSKCRYCGALGHYIDECRKLKAAEEKRKQAQVA
ncbi:uncharacterized protein SPAPADRAFT_65259 [Spathaspora passalidarum NRRL Y-27907]|uniref:CCHC-type domain-containing protein n=1 Tax=Spathaspora passalidarum (strain NRRL Y-27907 / 11-Y1) TaxID=619300 RepID=G3AHB6_SPAPN|nr:uncharacterized protein SPAPADRAFT_65259 [Spathaspora passalidarum NRRL Y-27907]EGW34080.1 hypothetical protein SPAPADRAFT_65259 [Spathaspora passalidarum NRRL Y-27907]